ncbi:MAG: Ala-tRNA(Pro) deacylase, partial [Gammaproteobacteria bacterium]
MSIPQTVIDFLARQDARYEVSHHPHTSSSWQTVIATHVDPACFAKGVLLHDKEGYFLAVVPASKRVNVTLLAKEFGHRPEMVIEADLPRIFPDCERGALPALGAAYGL